MVALETWNGCGAGSHHGPSLHQQNISHFIQFWHEEALQHLKQWKCGGGVFLYVHSRMSRTLRRGDCQYMGWNVKAMTIWRPAAAKIGVQEEEKHEREGINEYTEHKATTSSSSPQAPLFCSS
jgi:hypothetical protein